jgi:Archaea-specific editing domain of threonyl-tRNA synthetase
MKAIYFHTEHFKCECVDNQKMVFVFNNNDKLTTFQISNSVVAKICFVDNDVIGVSRAFYNDILGYCSNIGCYNVVLFPFAHLASNLLDLSDSILLYEKIIEIFSESSVIKSYYLPFYFDKEYSMHVKGHSYNVSWRDIECDTLSLK